MSIGAKMAVRRGALSCDVDLTVRPGETVALLGPNGAGKTTVLRCLAGLTAVDAGRVTIDDEVVDDPARRLFVGPEQRHVGVVFQDYVLFAHMSVLENVAYGMRARGVRRRDARRVSGDWLERVGLTAYAAQRPAALSGGQAQRVALARALAPAPRVLLLDEPLAALDAGTRAETRRDLAHHLADFAGMTVLVTHDPVDVEALADSVVVLEHGHAVQEGTLAQVTAHPRSQYVADLAGSNLVRGIVTNGVLLTPTGTAVVVAGALPGPTLAAIRPQAIALQRDVPAGSPRNAWRCSVREIDRHGDRVRVRLDGALPVVAEVTAAAIESLGLRVGDDVWAVVKATDIASSPS